jgi:hypothetical protein
MGYSQGQMLTAVQMRVKEADAWTFVREYKLKYEPVPDGFAHLVDVFDNPEDQWEDSNTPDRLRLTTLSECAEPLASKATRWCRRASRRRGSSGRRRRTR